jgi:hypothetical protein
MYLYKCTALCYCRIFKYCLKIYFVATVENKLRCHAYVQQHNFFGGLS